MEKIYFIVFMFFYYMIVYVWYILKMSNPANIIPEYTVFIALLDHMGQ